MYSQIFSGVVAVGVIGLVVAVTLGLASDGDHKANLARTSKVAQEILRIDRGRTFREGTSGGAAGGVTLLRTHLLETVSIEYYPKTESIQIVAPSPELRDTIARIITGYYDNSVQVVTAAERQRQRTAG